MAVALQLCAAAAAAAEAGAAAPAHPHIALIVSDDLGWDDVGFRSHQIRTPNIDKLAAAGRVLEHYYVQDVCSPTRAAFQTGRYPLHNTVNDWLKSGGALPLNETLLPRKLSAAGYISHAVGKWHLGYLCWEHTPTFRGYSSFYGFYSGGQDYFNHGGKGHLDFHLEVGERCGENCSQAPWEAVGHYSTTLFTSRAVAIVADHDPGAPLFMYLAYQAVHGPREVPKSYSDAYTGTIKDGARRTFAGMLTCMDEGIGNFTAALHARGMLEHTLIIFTTDNGGPVPDTPGGDYVGSRNHPLRGGKHSIWEGGTRGTALVWAGSATGLIPPSLVGKPVPALMHAVDWLPTFCTVAGVADCGGRGLPLDGVDVSGPLFNDAPGGHEFVLYGQHDDAPNLYKPYDDAVRDAEGWKLIQGWGGKPSDWSSPVNASAHSGVDLPDAAQTCTTPNCDADVLNPYGIPSAAMMLPRALNCTSTQPCCYTHNDMKHSNESGPAGCCAACGQLVGCVGWVFNTQATPNCWTKSKMEWKYRQCHASCTSGGAFPPPGPTPAPPPPPGKQNQTLLFNVVTDPEERHEVSAAHPDVVSRLASVLNGMRRGAVKYSDHLNCSGNKNGRVTPNGTVATPWCVPLNPLPK